MKNIILNTDNETISADKDKVTLKGTIKNTDINVLLNRVKINQKKESKKKLYFSAAASTGLILFGLIIF